MIDASDLRINNYVWNEYGGHYLVDELHQDRVLLRKEGMSVNGSFAYNDISGIQLTEDILIKAGFYKLDHPTITNAFLFEIGRNRVISIGSLGTPNEMIWICENDGDKITDLICIRNYDYDGKTYVHTIQNIIHYLTGTELDIKL